ncbi:MAG: hypothetical protein NTW67_02020 [Candidatus Woesearchaeota archaeon]|nr:hypothetical protein [Candidatus Woesearchaeota archaeon]
MVLEELYSAQFLHEHPGYGFLLGVGYTILGLFIAIMMFPRDPALIALGITCLFLMPSLSKLTNSEEITQQKKPTVKQFFTDVIPHAKVYASIFFGIFFTFAFFSIMLPSLAAGHLFQVQLAVATGQASNFSFPLFWELFTWNLQVLGMSFLLSLIAGNGGIIFVAWNASVWGTVFGNLAKTAALQSTLNPVILFVLIIISVFPHTFMEGLSYMLSAISGSSLSDGIVKQKMFSKQMTTILKYNLLLLLAAICVLAIGMMIETYVLGNFDTYRKIIEIAFPR